MFVILLVIADYLDKMHRRGNKLLLVHCVELPEMTRNVARVSSTSTFSSLHCVEKSTYFCQIFFG